VSARNLVDGDRYSYATAPEVVLDLESPVTFNIVRLRENIKLGQRIEAFELDAWRDGGWRTFAQATSIGACRIVRANVTTSRVRLRITKSPVQPALSELGLY
jgi:alpha-L-fucosidase